MKNRNLGRKLDKVLCLFLLGVLLTVGVYGCDNGKLPSQDTESTQAVADSEAESSETVTDEGIPGWVQHAEEEVTLDWYINFSWYNTPWGHNAVSQMITEKTGVNINFITPVGNEAEKFDALISSNTLPDIITLGWWENQLDEMIARDMVYALNELADEYDAYFWEVADPTIVEWYKSADGNLYSYPNSSYVPSDYKTYDNIASNQTFLVRKDIYEAIGSPDMTTPEGFQNAVRAAAAKFPEVDGYPLIPIGAHIFTDTGCDSFDKHLWNFLAVPFEKDGKYYDRYTNEDYITWLKAFRELGAEGYLKEDIFIDQRTQMDEKLARGQYFCMIYQRTDMAAQQVQLYAKDPAKIYLAIDGPKNAAGDDHVLPGAGINGWTVTLISKNCERPDRAIEFLSFLMSEEGQKSIFLGVEGVTYDIVDGQLQIKKEIQELINTDRAEYDRLYGADDAYWMLQDNIMQLKWKQPLTEPNGQLEEWTYPYSSYLGQYEISLDANTEEGSIYQKVQKLWSKALPKLLLAPTEEEFDSIFAQFLAERDQLGYDKVIEVCTKQIQDNKRRLGIE